MALVLPAVMTDLGQAHHGVLATGDATDGTLPHLSNHNSGEGAMLDVSFLDNLAVRLPIVCSISRVPQSWAAEAAETADAFCHVVYGRRLRLRARRTRWTPGSSTVWTDWTPWAS